MVHCLRRPRISCENPSEFVSCSDFLNVCIDVIFSLPQYERSDITSNVADLYSDVRESYTSKILQQFNVLILALTVVGNPYGFNFKQNVEAFHELNIVSYFRFQSGLKFTFSGV